MQTFTVVPLLLSLAAIPSLAWAQPAASLAELARRLEAGDHVKVRDADGRTASGRITLVTAEELAIRTARGSERYRAGEIRRVWTRGDSVGNGALIGLSVGAALGVAAGMESQGTLFEVNPALCGAITGGLGAGIGALLDWALPGRTVFAAGTSVTAVPLVEPRGAGARVVVRW